MKKKLQHICLLISKLAYAFKFNWILFVTLLVCAGLISIYSIKIDSILPALVTFFEPLSNLLALSQAFSYIVILLIISIDVFLWNQKTSINPYVIIIISTIILLIYLTPYKCFLDISNGLSWKWILIVSCIPVITKELKNYIRIWKIYRPIRKDKKTTGFTKKTPDDNLIYTGWDRYVDVLRRRLKDTSLNNENYAVGITGNWGTGKTTFLSVLKGAIAIDFIVADFCAWESNNTKTLIRDFFGCLNSVLECNGLKYDFTKYIDLLEDSGIPAYIKKINNLIDHEGNSVESEKKKIERQLRLINRPIVVIIDDADRMDNAELMGLFRIIRVTANFNNIIFVVAYDKRYVVNQIEKNGLKNGNEYLKKIFQLEISLPSDSREYIPELMIKELLFHKLPNDFIDAVRRQINATRGESHLHPLTNSIRTYRDVKIFVNSLLVAYDLISKDNLQYEISYANIFWIELLRQFYYDVYEILRNKPKRILNVLPSETGNGQLYTYIRNTTKGDQDDIHEDGKLKIVDKDVSLILYILFSDRRNEQTSIRRINNYRKYFDYRLPSNVISNLEFQEILSNDNPSIIHGWINDTLSEHKGLSLYNHLSLFSAVKCNENHRLLAQNFIYIALQLVNKQPLLIYDEFVKNILESRSYKIELGEYAKGVISQCLQDENCSYASWNKIFASLHSVEIYDSSDGSTIIHYKSIIDNESLVNFACENCIRYLNSIDPSPKIEMITSRHSSLHEFVSNACVITSEIPEGDITNRENLIFQALIKFYTPKKKENNKEAFLQPFQINYDGYYPEIENDILLEKEKLFGTSKKFKEFLRECFE